MYPKQYPITLLSRRFATETITTRECTPAILPLDSIIFRAISSQHMSRAFRIVLVIFYSKSQAIIFNKFRQHLVIQMNSIVQFPNLIEQAFIVRTIGCMQRTSVRIHIENVSFIIDNILFDVIHSWVCIGCRMLPYIYA